MPLSKKLDKEVITKQNKSQKSGLGPIIAGTVGVIAGAGIAAAALSDKKTKKMFKKKVSDAMDTVKETVKEKLDELKEVDLG